MLTNLPSLKFFLGLQSDASEDNKLSLVLSGVDRAVKGYLGRGRTQSGFTSWPESGSATEYYDGSGRRELVLRHSPVSAVASVYLDNAGYYGDGTNAFASTALLTAGTDYVLKKDDGATGSAVGKLIRLGSGSSASLNDEWHWFPPSNQEGGTLTAQRAAVWTRGTGNIKVTYTAGFTTIPDDLEMAVWQMCSFVRAGAQYGGVMPGSESLGEYSYSLASQALTTGAAALTDVRTTLNRYRDLYAA